MGSSWLYRNRPLSRHPLRALTVMPADTWGVTLATNHYRRFVASLPPLTVEHLGFVP